MESAAQTQKSFNIFPPPVNPSDSTTHVDAISGTTYFLQGNVCECVCAALKCELREMGEGGGGGGGFGTCFEPAIINERLSGLLRFVPVLLED